MYGIHTQITIKFESESDGSWVILDTCWHAFATNVVIKTWPLPLLFGEMAEWGRITCLINVGSCYKALQLEGGLRGSPAVLTVQGQTRCE